MTLTTEQKGLLWAGGASKDVRDELDHSPLTADLIFKLSNAQSSNQEVSKTASAAFLNALNSDPKFVDRIEDQLNKNGKFADRVIALKIKDPQALVDIVGSLKSDTGHAEKYLHEAEVKAGLASAAPAASTAPPQSTPQTPAPVKPQPAPRQSGDSHGSPAKAPAVEPNPSVPPTSAPARAGDNPQTGGVTANSSKVPPATPAAQPPATQTGSTASDDDIQKKILEFLGDPDDKNNPNAPLIAAMSKLNDDQKKAMKEAFAAKLKEDPNFLDEVKDLQKKYPQIFKNMTDHLGDGPADKEGFKKSLEKNLNSVTELEGLDQKKEMLLMFVGMIGTMFGHPEWAQQLDHFITPMIDKMGSTQAGQKGLQMIGGLFNEASSPGTTPPPATVPPSTPTGTLSGTSNNGFGGVQLGSKVTQPDGKEYIVGLVPTTPTPAQPQPAPAQP